MPPSLATQRPHWMPSWIVSRHRRQQSAQGPGHYPVAEVRVGNAFTNANKALAHFMAYGRDALTAPPPRLYAGMHLRRAVLETVAASLERHGLLPRPTVR